MRISKHLWGIVAVVVLLLGSVGLGTVSAAPGLQWTVPMVADAGTEGSNSNLAFGIHTDATDGFDSSIDLPHPPAGPGALSEAYFSIIHQLFPKLDKDFRGEGLPKEWTLKVSSTSQSIGLSWNTAGVPQDVALRLTGSGKDINMLAQTSTTLPAGSHTLTIAATEIQKYALTMAVAPSGKGTATDETGTGPYLPGTAVSIKAVANAGYRFVNWTAPAGTLANANALATNFTMPGQNVTVTANFVRVYNLTMARNPVPGGTATDLTNASPYEAGSPVSIKAVANTGYKFGSWTAPAGTFADANAAQTTFTVPAQDVTVTANFVVFSAPGNVDLRGAGAGVASINVTGIALGAVNITNMPDGIQPQEAYVVDSTGSGSFTLRFTDVTNAANILVYKVVGSTWTQVPPAAITVIGSTTLEITMAVGDPILVFASAAGPVGGTAYPANKLLLLAPWVALAAAIAAGSLLVLRRRRAQS